MFGTASRSIITTALITGVAVGAQFTTAWQLGNDDSSELPFSQESFGPNSAPGSASAKDDDYYFAGSYAAPVGVVASDESAVNFERAVTSGDPRNRIHFPLTVAQASATSRLRITVDLFNGGAWINGTIPGFSTHDISLTLNGTSLGTFNTISWNRTLVITVPATSAGAVPGANTLQIERTGGGAGGYIEFDFLKLEVDSDALTDNDADGMPLWFEETYGLSDSSAADALLDPDADGLNNRAEFQAGTNPTDPDTDNDGLTDSQEVAMGTNPLKADTDGDGIADGVEKNSSPLLADTDGDSYTDNIEIEQGTNPQSASSVPFSFPGAIGLQFLSESLDSAILPANEPAGYFRFPNWNSSARLPQWTADGTVLTGSKSSLKNHRGQVTSASATWSYHFASQGLHKGPGDERLLDGLIRTERSATVNTLATVTISGVPYATYDILVYVGFDYRNNARGVVHLGAGPPFSAVNDRYFVSASFPPFIDWSEIKSTTLATILPGNYVRYRNLTGSSQTVSLESIDNDSLGIHGIQIINSGADTDGDGMSDALEVENHFNPALADANADADSDGMSNAAEIAAGTDPHDPDTDHDGLADGAESAHGTSPLNPDSDGDTLLDGDEIFASPFPSNPTLIDSDTDGFSDAVERKYGSNPLSAASTPPPVPVWDVATHTWRWRIDNLRVLWNHDQSMLGAIEYDDTMLCEAAVDIEQSGWGRQIGMGIRYVGGKLVHRFRGIEGAFYQSGHPDWGFWDSDWSASPVDRMQDFGFSGCGPADDSYPLRMEFTAVQQYPLNLWTLTFRISNLTNPASPVTIATYTSASAVAADSSLIAGTTVWKNSQGVTGRIDYSLETGVQALVTPNALGPVDTDNDGMPDTWETAHSFNPNSAADASTDADGDGLSNLREFLIGTDPRDADSDDDGAPDGVELNNGTNPLNASSIPAWFAFTGKIDDLDGDGLSDAWVLWSGGKHRVASTDDDGDGVSNLDESKAGTNPDDANSHFDLKGWRENNNFVLSWTDLPYKANRVEISDALGGWQSATGFAASGIVGGRRQVAILSEFPSAGGRRFYRAGVQPTDTDGDGVEDWVEKNVLDSSIIATASLGQSLVRSNGQTLSGDAAVLLDRLQGSSPLGGAPGSIAAGKPSPVNASRFLMQASFGPTSQSIQEVRDLGFSAWIDQQIGLPSSLLQPYIKQIKADGAGPRSDPYYNFNDTDKFVYGNNVTTPFARNAISGADQLRQRVAFALSQILVVSRRDANLEEKPEAMANYYDTLTRNALGNYGDLLREITFHPAMGWYLSHAGNQKADPSIPRYPDENYAREIMQLFTIGIWQLNPDGSRKLSASGEPIPTYDNGDITELSRVFTGLYFASPYGWGGGGWADEHFIVPMVMYPERHDFDAKHLTNGVILPAREATEMNGLQEVRDAVDALFHHPNTPPFVCRQLIQFLVTDNPSPGYVRRIQDVFVNDGAGIRGNLAAVVKAILLDSEARLQPLSPSFGKVREPVIRTIHLGRLCHLAEAHPNFVWWNWTDNFYSFSSEEPMNSPSVFNFYTPVYQAPGDIRNAGLVSPGFQIVNTYSAISFPNLLWEYLHDGFKSGWTWEFPMDYRDSLNLAGNPEALADQVNLLVCAGMMTARTRGIMLGALANPALGQKERVALALWIAMTSPEGVVQK